MFHVKPLPVGYDAWHGAGHVGVHFLLRDANELVALAKRAYGDRACGDRNGRPLQ